MASNHLATRTYTAPTCTLIVSNQGAQLAGDRDFRHNPVDFSLELERSTLGEIDRVTLQGQPQQLDHLHQILNKYIAELVAKFPLTTASHQHAPESERLPQVDPEDIPFDPHPDPRVAARSPRSGILKHLPGLRHVSPQSLASNTHPQSDRDEKPSISQLLGLWNQHSHRDLRSDNSTEQKSSKNPPTIPYLVAVGDRPLDHQLHLGNLKTLASGEVLILSAIQLFDLATVLDEYATEHITITDRPNNFNRASANPQGERSQAAATIDTTHSRLPNLPNIPTRTEVGQAYDRTPRSRSSLFMSAIPWTVGAATAVALPLLFLGPNPNPLKDAANQLKPNLTATKKSTTAMAPGQPPPTSDLETATSPLPTPWQPQPVFIPPSNNQLDLPKVQTSQDPSKIGIAPLPDRILGKSGQDLTPITKPIAPNPLNSTQLPADLTKSVPVTTLSPTNAAKSTRVAGSTSQPTPQKIGQLPLDPNAAGKISVSTQPILMPPERPKSVSMPSPIPFDRAGLDESGRIDPFTRSPNPQKTPQQVKPTPAATTPTPTPLQPTETGAKPASSEPLTPAPSNPNLINPEQNGPDAAEPQAPPVVPNQPLQSNAGDLGTDPAENSSLQETKRYFQGKWKAITTQPNALQYVLQVSGKSGTVRSIDPQGAAATTYLQQTKFINLGQKLISPAATGNNDQKIRVLLQPDGNVDTFIEP
jgi:Domain of unknown function (DUF4335)